MTVSLASPAGICVSVAGKDISEAIDIARQSESLADVIEIRLDSLPRPQVAPFIEHLAKPLLFTNRPEWEGGSFKGEETARIEVLRQAVQHDCALVDLELRAAPALRAELLDTLLQHPRTSLIISWHDFEATPAAAELDEILLQQMESGAHIGKIVTYARDYRDVLRILNLQTMAAENGFRLIAFCMGEAGRISRLATTRLGGYMTYGAPDRGRETAPGQIRVSVLKDILERIDDYD